MCRVVVWVTPCAKLMAGQEFSKIANIKTLTGTQTEHLLSLLQKPLNILGKPVAPKPGKKRARTPDVSYVVKQYLGV